MTLVAPSILSADFTELGKDIISIKDSADWIHFDVMDGVFVPNISVGVPVLKSLRRATDMFIDVHLMIVEPQKITRAFCDAGADMVTAHVEAAEPDGINEFINIVKENGKKVGLSIKPSTPVEYILPYLDKIDMVLVMTVNPGFGGQKFISPMLDKISALKKIIDEKNLNCLIEVDGGINAETAALCRESGAEVLVAGSYVFNASDRAAAIASLK